MKNMLARQQTSTIYPKIKNKNLHSCRKFGNIVCMTNSLVNSCWILWLVEYNWTTKYLMIRGFHVQSLCLFYYFSAMRTWNVHFSSFKGKNITEKLVYKTFMHNIKDFNSIISQIWNHNNIDICVIQEMYIESKLVEAWYTLDKFTFNQVH